MGSHPINLTIRFLLELSALLAMGIWGWRLSDGWIRFGAGLGLPLLAAVLWGIFAVPGDPSRSGAAPIAVHGVIRLALELAVFAFAIWAIYDLGQTKLCWILTLIVTIHYFASYDRILWLLTK